MPFRRVSVLALAICVFTGLAAAAGSVEDVFGAKKGKVYHLYLDDCSVARRIKPENIMRFTSAAQAEQSGRHLCKTCEKIRDKHLAEQTATKPDPKPVHKDNPRSAQKKPPPATLPAEPDPDTASVIPQFARIEHVLPLPPSLDVIEAAALPEALFTAWTNIMDTGRLQSGETLLVHGGTSGIGVITVQMFSRLGHTVFATAGSDEKCRLCEELGAKRAINYRTEDFVAVTKDATGGKGVDVILDMVGGDYVQRNMTAAAMWGRIVNIAYQKGAAVEVNFMPLMIKRLALMGTTLRNRSVGEKAAIRDALAREVWPLVAAGRIKPVVEARLPLAEAKKAHEIMAASGHIGKILLVP